MLDGIVRYAEHNPWVTGHKKQADNEAEVDLSGNVSDIFQITVLALSTAYERLLESEYQKLTFEHHWSNARRRRSFAAYGSIMVFVVGLDESRSTRQ